MRLFLAITLLVLLTCSPLVAAEIEPLFQRLEAAATNVRTVTSAFTQEKRLAIFDEVLTSSGRFAFAKPDQLRWELLEPVKAGFVLSGDRGRRWHGRAGTSESFDIRTDPMMRIVAEQLLAWARADFGWLRERYQLEVLGENPATLKLMPRTGGGFLDHLRIIFAADDTHVQQVEMHEQDGDATILRFSDATINQPLPDATFRN
ncbi:MAG: outer membrane lipoprotein carrier protein LolA [Desulfuromonadales bacterium]|nr:outer membrane lipoprotein carrier protein LolA [Desulfuromonadales bacterium]